MPTPPPLSRAGSRESRLGRALIVASAVYLAAALVLFAFCAPFHFRILGLEIAFSSLVKPARLALGLALLGGLFHFIGEKKRRPDLTFNRFGAEIGSAFQRGIAPFRRCVSFAPALALLFLGVYCVGYKVRQQLTFDTGALDLSLIDHALYNTPHGKFLHAYSLDRNYFSDHFSPILLPIVPLYLLWSSPAVLLAIQGLAAAAAAGALARTAREGGLPRGIALLAGLIFVFHPKYWEGFRFDFHHELLFPPLLFLAVSCLNRRRFARFFLLCLAALTIKEDVSLYFVFLGLYVALRHSRRWGAAQAVVSAAWALAAFCLIIPRSFPEPQAVSHFVSRYQHLGSGYLGIVGGIISSFPQLAGKTLAAAFRLLLPSLLYLPLLSPGYFILGLFPIGLNVISGYDYQASLGAYYGVMGLSFFALGFVDVLGRLSRRSPAGLAAAAVIALYLAVGLEIPLWRPILASDRALERALSGLPGERKTISAQSVIVPHLPREDRIYVFPRVEEADLVLLYLRPGRIATWPLEPPAYFREIKKLLGNGDFRVLLFNGSALFLERGRRDPISSRAALSVIKERGRMETYDP